MKIVKFHDLELDEIHYGFRLSDGTVECACCGGTFPPDEEGETFKILTERSSEYLEETLKQYMEG